MSVLTRAMTSALRQRFEGALVGALVGDCLGSPFEFDKPKAKVNRILKFMQDIEEGKQKFVRYTDDTAMTKSVSISLIEQKQFDARDLAKNFTEEYFEDDTDRGYGGNIPDVFHELRRTNYTDPFGPAARQFNGSGSYGNGGAMRITPAALFGLNFDDSDFNDLVDGITRVTHAHVLGINGAILEATAVRLALRSATGGEALELLADLQTKMSDLEKSNSREQPYGDKLQIIEGFIRDSEPNSDKVAKALGNDVSALGSVPAAVFSFLRSLGEPRDEWEREYNPFERTIVYAISLGGDTDTIACMAGAIAGAYYGVKSIPEAWQRVCEGLGDVKEHARELFSLAKNNKASL